MGFAVGFVPKTPRDDEPGSLLAQSLSGAACWRARLSGHLAAAHVGSARTGEPIGIPAERLEKGALYPEALTI
ncbi:hypothetical protein AM571_PC02147 (plasmid) [Rhizobium etli 8C-3]|uniref:Uncharacterized protein n=1 Tax=Rhizobium etli 8C-3 TaxID=538025 RepID=A0A1L5PI87_RHIET|nr:hypothetical protein AM571_PC02147 [Rhizobium etli 8C-3]